MAKADMTNVLRVVMLGKTGAGKSSTGNTLLGRDAFRVARGLRSGTERCQWADEDVEGVTLQITDTPGLSDTHRPEAEVLKEVGKSIAVASPGPHVILMVARCDSRFTKEEAMAFLTLKNMFGPDVKKYMIVVFVGADSYGDTLEEQAAGVKESMDVAEGPLKDLLDDADKRFYAINNKASPADRRIQAAELIDLMQNLKEMRGGTYFKNSVSDRVNNLVEPLVQNRTAGGNMTRAQAIHETNRAIVDETESPGFFSQLMDTLENTVLPAIKKAAKVVKQGLEVAGQVLEVIAEAQDSRAMENCSVM